MVGNYSGEEKRMQESMAAYVRSEEKKTHDRMVDGYNIMCAALAWFSSHSVEEKLGHVPQWVTMGRELTVRT